MPFCVHTADMPETISFKRRNLPHWMVAERAYFVTFRQKGTLPRALVDRLRSEREELRAENADEQKLADLAARQFERVDAILDRTDPSNGDLCVEGCAQSILDAFQWLESNAGWVVYAVTVMPNHVHAVMRNKVGRNGDLGKDLGRLKSFTSREINRILGRQGPFWQTEGFDHWCRTPDEFDRFCSYTIGNPVKAGWVEKPEDWRWTRIKPQ